jgi:hypothetical protein
MFRLGRIALWILFFPLGIWRSVVHGRRQRDARLVAAMGGNPKTVTQRTTLASLLMGRLRKKEST